MPDARIIGVADAIVTAIDTAWAQGASDTVSRVYVAPVSVDDLNALTGRHVYVFPAGYSDQLETRGENRFFYTLGVLIVERYTDAGFPTKAWMDERVYFVENTVKDACDYDRSPLMIGTREIYTEDIQVTVYDIEKLNQKNLFWSELEVTLWEVATP